MVLLARCVVHALLSWLGKRLARSVLTPLVPFALLVVAALLPALLPRAQPRTSRPRVPLVATAALGGRVRLVHHLGARLVSPAGLVLLARCVVHALLSWLEERGAHPVLTLLVLCAEGVSSALQVGVARLLVREASAQPRRPRPVRPSHLGGAAGVGGVSPLCTWPPSVLGTAATPPSAGAVVVARALLSLPDVRQAPLRAVRDCATGGVRLPVEDAAHLSRAAVPVVAAVGALEVVVVPSQALPPPDGAALLARLQLGMAHLRVHRRAVGRASDVSSVAEVPLVAVLVASAVGALGALRRQRGTDDNGGRPPRGHGGRAHRHPPQRRHPSVGEPLLALPLPQLAAVFPQLQLGVALAAVAEAGAGALAVQAVPRALLAVAVHVLVALHAVRVLLVAALALPPSGDADVLTEVELGVARASLAVLQRVAGDVAGEAERRVGRPVDAACHGGAEDGLRHDLPSVHVALGVARVVVVAVLQAHAGAVLVGVHAPHPPVLAGAVSEVHSVLGRGDAAAHVVDVAEQASQELGVAVRLAVGDKVPSEERDGDRLLEVLPDHVRRLLRAGVAAVSDDVLAGEERHGRGHVAGVRMLHTLVEDVVPLEPLGTLG